MSTSAIIKIYDENKNLLTIIYKHYDGGKDLKNKLKNIIKNKVIVNGIPINYNNNICNGMGDFAAQLIFELKKNNYVGDIYVLNINSNIQYANYIYEIYEKNNKIYLKEQKL